MSEMSEMSAHACDASELSIGQCATLACLLEVSAPKPGNVHRGADFEDMTFVDFAVSAVAIAPAMEKAVRHGVGPTVWESIRATRALIRTNTNMGTVLLLAPLAAVPRSQRLQPGVQQVLAALTPLDSRQVYEAIRLVHPGGLGQVDSMDVAAEAPADLLAAMEAASDRDLVASQYVTGFAVVLQEVLPWLLAGPGQGWSLADTIVHTQLRLLSRYGDSLIARKCGPALDSQVAAWATRALEAGSPGDEAYGEAVADLDFWLRSDHHRRNPGTTADLIAAGLFAALRDDLLCPWLGQGF
jgi:triphosphoribosyl-dephospho-CoA synthase